MSGDFDRIKRVDERLLQREGRTAADAGGEGRGQLFSAGTTGRPAGAPAAAGLVVHCDSCGVTTPVEPADLARMALPLFLVLPWRRHPVFALCPACRRRSWLAIRPT